jgi:ABC-type phosphate transport system substrate-binding protein
MKTATSILALLLLAGGWVEAQGLPNGEFMIHGSPADVGRSDGMALSGIPAGFATAFPPGPISTVLVSVTIIVHASNPTGAMPTDVISRIFLKRNTRWPSGAQVAPVDQDGDSSTRSSFARTIHDRSASALDNYWQQQIYSGGNAPPPVVGSDAHVIAFVGKNPNAIGYVAGATDLPATVRVLQVRAR